MAEARRYSGIDVFRLVAAVLVVAVHTSPLLTVDATADFVLTRIVARIAVPFFFVTSGFFLLSPKPGRLGRIGAFVRRTAGLYGGATLLYAPLIVYAGHLADWWPVGNLLRTVVFDGTFYHLWYLPAAALGAVLTAALLGRLRAGLAFGVTLLLYAIGLGGDSYFGLVAGGPAGGLYEGLFRFASFTRNGLFMAPVFFAIGALAARRGRPLRLPVALAGLVCSFSLMLAEGLWLHGLGVQHHDSMYIMLLPCLYFLFQCLLHVQRGEARQLRPLSLHVYIVHPLMVVAVRGAAKVIGYESVFIEHSVWHFVAVTVASVAVAILYETGRQWWRRTRGGAAAGAPELRPYRVWAEISLTDLDHNVAVMRRLLPKRTQIMAVLKADAYGHGDVALARHLAQRGIRAFAVATADEGVRLRQHGIPGDIVVLGHTAPERSRTLAQYGLTQTVADPVHAAQLNEAGHRLDVQVKVDTGMHRLGADATDVDGVASMFHMPNLRVTGMFTHLAVPDSLTANDVAFTRTQLARFDRLLNALRVQGVRLPRTHVLSTYGVLNYPDVQGDYARLGLALYGVLSTPNPETILTADLRPIMSVRATVAAVKTVASGDAVGYGRAFVADTAMRIAVIPVGYADGWPRSLSGTGCGVLVRGQRCPIVGRVCMDQMMVDVTSIADVQAGDVATLIGRDGAAEITAAEVAAAAGTITNELLSRLGGRVQRVYM